jgi:hypothetical protein
MILLCAYPRSLNFSFHCYVPAVGIQHGAWVVNPLDSGSLERSVVEASIVVEAALMVLLA